MADRSVTLEVFQLPIGWLKAAAFKNMADMVVTLAVFQLPMGWLKSKAPLNRPFISVTPAVFQLPILAGPFSMAQPSNMRDMSVTPLRLGRSAALTCRLAQPRKAEPILVQATSPHCTMVSSLRRSPALL